MKEKVKNTLLAICIATIGFMGVALMNVTPTETSEDYRDGYREGYHKACADLALMNQGQ